MASTAAGVATVRAGGVAPCGERARPGHGAGTVADMPATPVLPPPTVELRAAP